MFQNQATFSALFSALGSQVLILQLLVSEPTCKSASWHQCPGDQCLPQCSWSAVLVLREDWLQRRPWLVGSFSVRGNDVVTLVFYEIPSLQCPIVLLWIAPEPENFPLLGRRLYVETRTHWNSWASWKDTPLSIAMIEDLNNTGWGFRRKVLFSDGINHSLKYF